MFFFYDEKDVPVIDPYFSNTSLLLKMDSDFSDSSVYNHNITATGNARILSSQSKYGGASGYFDGNGDRINVPSTSTLQFGTGDFTVEAWIRPSSIPTGNYLTDGTIFGSMSTSPNMLFFLTNNYNRPAFWDGSAQRTSNVSLSTNEWSHVAWVRNSGILKIYVNGNLAGQWSNSTNLPAGTFYIGGQPSNRYFHGYIDDLRITKGIARYTANFTPPESHPTTGPANFLLEDGSSLLLEDSSNLLLEY